MECGTLKFRLFLATLEVSHSKVFAGAIRESPLRVLLHFPEFTFYRAIIVLGSTAISSFAT